MHAQVGGLGGGGKSPQTFPLPMHHFLQKTVLEYMDAMRVMGFSVAMPLFIASGARVDSVGGLKCIPSSGRASDPPRPDLQGS